MGTWFAGSWDYLWPWLETARRLGVTYPADQDAALDDHVAICRSIGWWYPFADFCITTDRPEAIRRDSKGRLHAKDEPALLYRDGYALFATHGKVQAREAAI